MPSIQVQALHIANCIIKVSQLPYSPLSCSNPWENPIQFHKYLVAAEMFEEAALALEKTVELNPGYAPAHYELAKTYSRSGQRERAVEERKIHHQLVTQRRDEAERRRQENPRLPYSVVSP